MTVFLLIAQYVKFEESYENFILESDNLYRVTLTSYINNELVMASAENYPGLGPALANELPEVEGYGINSFTGFTSHQTIKAAKTNPVDSLRYE